MFHNHAIFIDTLNKTNKIDIYQLIKQLYICLFGFLYNKKKQKQILYNIFFSLSLINNYN